MTDQQRLTGAGQVGGFSGGAGGHSLAPGLAKGAVQIKEILYFGRKSEN